MRKLFVYKELSPLPDKLRGGGTGFGGLTPWSGSLFGRLHGSLWRVQPKVHWGFYAVAAQRPGMLKVAGDDRFVDEPRPFLGIAGSAQELDRHLPAELPLQRTVDLAEPA